MLASPSFCFEVCGLWPQCLNWIALPLFSFYNRATALGFYLAVSSRDFIPWSQAFPHPHYPPPPHLFFLRKRNWSAPPPPLLHHADPLDLLPPLLALSVVSSRLSWGPGVPGRIEVQMFPEVVGVSHIKERWWQFETRWWCKVCISNWLVAQLDYEIREQRNIA